MVLRLYHVGQSLLLSAIYRGGPLILGIFGSLLLLRAPLRGHLSLLEILHWPFLL